MIIYKEISELLVSSDSSVLSALRKIDENEQQIVFVVTSTGHLDGVLTDGDFRRWLVDNHDDNTNLNQPVRDVMNKQYCFSLVDDEPDKIRSLFNQRIKFIPLLDTGGRIVAIAKRRTKSIAIGDRKIDDTSQTFIIAEIGNNHNGDLLLAKKLVNSAKEAGADCAKFQMRDMECLYWNSGQSDDNREDLGSQYTLDLLSRFQLSNEELFDIFDYCKEIGIMPLCTPWDKNSFVRLESYGLQAFKVASADFTNPEMLEMMAKSGKPLICSTGMTTEDEIVESVNLLRHFGAQYVLLHCNSAYPAPFEDINLGYLDRLIAIGDCHVGYSGHERGINISMAAVSRGAKVVEKHLTLDRSLEGNDHKVSLLPNEFKQMVQGIREIELALSKTQARTITQGEMLNREILGKSLVINRDLKKGKEITADMVEIKAPGKGLQPYYRKQLIGKVSKHMFREGDFFFQSDLDADEVRSRTYSFTRPWGIPVRYHDFNELVTCSNFDLIEFHLSYKDLQQDIGEYFTEPMELDIVVHCPELFAGDHLLDLCSEDETYRLQSVSNLQNVVDITKTLTPYFHNTSFPLIIVNVGGFTQDAPLSTEQIAGYYDRLLVSLSEVNTEGVELIPQTMPPFPWLFGGQRFHNLFVNPDEIVKFCVQNNVRICLDTSHSALACNHFSWSFREFVETLGSFVGHIHVADASGVAEEGLQIGDGSIDFFSLGKILKEVSPSASFVPEIWQGHKNFGEGFWIALERLERWL